MICKTCGKENLDTATFCSMCGASLTENEAAEPASTASTKKKLPIKKILIGIVAALAVIVVLIIAISVIGSGSSPYACYEDVISVSYIPDEDKSLVFYNGTEIKTKIDGRAYIASENLKGDVAVIIAGEDNELYILNKKDLSKKIADDVSEAKIADNGATVAYTVYNSEKDESTLFTLDVKSKKTKEIADDVTNVMFSPDGEAFIYTTQTYDEDDYTYEYNYYIRMGAKTIEFEDFTPYTTSNGGKIIYGLNDDGDLATYNLKKGTSTKIGKAPTDDAMVNEDATELLYCADGKYYISKNGKESKSVGKYSALYLLLPSDAAYSPNTNARVVDTFFGTMMYWYEDGEYRIGYIDKKYEMNEVIKDVSGSIRISKDLSTIYFLKDDKLYSAKGKKFNQTKLASDVYSYNISLDGKVAYYLNDDEDSELYILRKGKAKRVDDDVYSFRVAKDGTVYFIKDYENDEGTLYRSKNGKTPTRIQDDVHAVYANTKYIEFYANYESTSEDDTVDWYISPNGKSFKRMTEGEEW